MKLLFASWLLFVLLETPPRVNAMVCGWRSPQGHEFNFAQLASVGDFKAQDSVSVFSVSVCEVSRSSQQCSNTQGMICEYRVGSNEFIAAVARVPSAEPAWRFIDEREPSAGVEMILRNGDDCRTWSESQRRYDSQNRQTVLRFFCSRDASMPGYLVSVDDNENSCISTATFNTPLACAAVGAGGYTGGDAYRGEGRGYDAARQQREGEGRFSPNGGEQEYRGGGEPAHITPQQPPNNNPSHAQPNTNARAYGSNNNNAAGASSGEPFGEVGGSSGWSFVFYVILIAAGYVSYGCAWNIYSKGHAEMPHAEFWRELPSLVVDGCYYFYHRILQFTQGSGGEGDYSSIPQNDSNGAFTI